MYWRCVCSDLAKPVIWRVFNFCSHPGILRHLSASLWDSFEFVQLICCFFQFDLYSHWSVSLHKHTCTQTQSYSRAQAWFILSALIRSERGCIWVREEVAWRTRTHCKCTYIHTDTETNLLKTLAHRQQNRMTGRLCIGLRSMSYTITIAYYSLRTKVITHLNISGYYR